MEFHLYRTDSSALSTHAMFFRCNGALTARWHRSDGTSTGQPYYEVAVVQRDRVKVPQLIIVGVSVLNIFPINYSWTAVHAHLNVGTYYYNQCTSIAPFFIY